MSRSETGELQAVLDNLSEDIYKEYTSLIERAAWWDDDKKIWNDLDDAAKKLQDFVEGYRDMLEADHDIDLSAVNYDGIVIDVVAQVNVDEGRASNAGDLETDWDD